MIEINKTISDSSIKILNIILLHTIKYTIAYIYSYKPTTFSFTISFLPLYKFIRICPT